MTQVRRAPSISVRDCISMERIEEFALSPDEEWVALISWRGDLSQENEKYVLRLVGARGDDVRVVATVSGHSRDFHGPVMASPVWSPDGTLLAYLAKDTDGVTQVWVLALTDASPRQISTSSDDVRSVAIGGSGASPVVVFSCGIATPAHQLRSRSLLWDIDGNPAAGRVAATGDAASPRADRRWFLQRVAPGATPTLLWDSTGQLRTASTGGSREAALLERLACAAVSPDGDRAVFWPYVAPGTAPPPARSRRYPYQFALVDVRTAAIEPLLPSAHDVGVAARAGGAPALFHPDGGGVIVVAPGSSEDIVEVDLSSRTVIRLATEPGVVPVRFDQSGGLRVQRGTSTRMLRRDAENQWRAYSEWEQTPASDAPGVSKMVSGARHSVGIMEGSTSPPELFVCGEDAKPRMLTDLNPELRQLLHAEARELLWASKYDPTCRGYLALPESSDGPLPLIVHLANLPFGPDTYLLDAAGQLGGLAIQPLVNVGIGVLIVCQPPSMAAVMGTELEGEHVRATVEAALLALIDDGVVEPRRIGLAGWSRMAYQINKLLLISDFEYACAALIDGGCAEYIDGMRPWTPTELRKIHAPVLIDCYDRGMTLFGGTFADGLRTYGKVVDIWAHALAGHNPRNPAVRKCSLEVHIDWFRYWLQGYVDSDPRKRKQYHTWTASKVVP